MFRRTSLSAEPKRYSASSLASCVLPTPVGPAKRNTPSGRRGSFRPALSSATERSTAATASVCPSSRSPKKRSVSSRSSGIASSTTKRGSRVAAQKRVSTSSGPTRSRAALAASAAVSLSSSIALRGMRWASRNLADRRSARSHAAGSMGRRISRSSSSATRPSTQRERSSGGSCSGIRWSRSARASSARSSSCTRLGSVSKMKRMPPVRRARMATGASGPPSARGKSRM